jgi:hypothetical protein
MFALLHCPVISVKPQVLDFSGLGPKTTLDIKLPQHACHLTSCSLKPCCISLLFVLFQVLDFSGLGPKTTLDIKLPHLTKYHVY